MSGAIAGQSAGRSDASLSQSASLFQPIASGLSQSTTSFVPPKTNIPTGGVDTTLAWPSRWARRARGAAASERGRAGLELLAFLANSTAGAGSSNLPFGVSDIGHVFVASPGGNAAADSSPVQSVEIPTAQESAHDLGGAIEETTDQTLDDAMDALLSLRVGESQSKWSDLEELLA